MVVQGEGDVVVDTGSGVDVIEVDTTFLGDITVENGEGTETDPSSLTVFVNDVVWGLQQAGGNDVRIGLNDNENEILLKDLVSQLTRTAIRQPMVTSQKRPGVLNQ